MPSEITYKEIVLYKTESCRNWDENGYCRYGKRCRYAHGKEELRPISRSSQYKTKFCKSYYDNGSCSYGIRCTFIHQKPKEHLDTAYSNKKSPPNVNTAINFISKNVWDSMIGLSSYEPSSS